MKVKVGDEVIFKPNMIHGAGFYHEQGIPSNIGGFRAKITVVEDDGKYIGYQIYWHNKVIANEYGAHNSCWTNATDIERVIDGNE